MGREIRMVPPNWEHPRWTADDTSDRHRIGKIRPTYDQDYESAAKEWLAELAAFKPTEYANYYWEWAGGPPDETAYRPAFTEEPTWFQVYETVSEGTPVTPPFATQDELIDYLVNVGEMAGTQYARKFSRESATKFVKGSGYAPSMIVMHGPEGTTIREGIDAAV